MSEYTEKAEQFLKQANVHFAVEYIGKDCPRFCKDNLAENGVNQLNVFPRKTHIHGWHYRCYLNRAGTTKTVSFDYWNSYADEEFNFARSHGYDLPFSYLTKLFGQADAGNLRVIQNKHKARTVSAYDLLACIQKYDPGTFENFCGDFGYDTDSRKAESTYHAVQKEYQKVSRFFTDAELVELQEIA